MNRDVSVAVRSDSKALGTLEISRGSIDWVPRGNSANKVGLTWERFDELMREHGTSKKIARRKKP